MKNTIKIIIFILGLFLIIAVLSYMFYPKTAGVDTFRLEGIKKENKNTIDTLIIGSSLSHTSISPMQIYDKYGFTSYNLGSNAQSLDIGYRYFKNTLKNQDLKILIIETDTFYKKRSISYDINNYLVNYAPIFKYHLRSKNYRIYKDVFKSIPDINRQITKGYYLIKKTDSGKNYNYMKETNDMQEISYKNLKTFNKIFNLAQKNNVKVIIFSSPSAISWNYSKHNSIVELSKKYNLKYFDMNLIPSIGIDWENDTKDGGDHLNYYGAYKATNYFADYLNSLKYLSDHREDEYYSYWNDDLNEYKNYLKDNNLK